MFSEFYIHGNKTGKTSSPVTPGLSVPLNGLKFVGPTEVSGTRDVDTDLLWKIYDLLTDARASDSNRYSLWSGVMTEVLGGRDTEPRCLRSRTLCIFVSRTGP